MLGMSLCYIKAVEADIIAPRMEKKFMRPGCSTSVSRRGALGGGLHLANLFWGQGRATDCLCLGGFFPDCSIQHESGWRVMPPNDTRRLVTLMKKSR